MTDDFELMNYQEGGYWYEAYQEVQAELEEAYDAINTYMEHLGRQWRGAIELGDEAGTKWAENQHEVACKMLIAKGK